MAEAGGNFQGQDFNLTNVATESTLQQLIGSIALLSTKIDNSKAGKKSQKQVEVEMQKFYKQLSTANDSILKKTKAERDAIIQQRKHTKAVTENSDALEKNTVRMQQAGAMLGALAKVAGQAEKAFIGMVNVLKDVSNVGNSMDAAAGVFGKIPIVGDVLSQSFGAVTQAASRSYEAFRTSASVGANFNNSISDLIDASSGAGLTIDDFSGIIQRTGPNVALLAGGTAEGAKRLALLGKSIRDSRVGDELARMGFSTVEINEGMANFAGRLARTGRLQTMTTQQIATVTGEYLKDLDAVAKLTGQSKQALQEQEEARMRDAQYLTMKNKLDPIGQKNLETLMNSIPAGLQAGAKEVLATGTATSEAGRNFLAFMNESGQNMQGLNASMRASGTLTKDQILESNRILKKSATEFVDSPVGETVGLFNTEVNDLTVGAFQLKGQQKNLSEVMAEQEKDMKRGSDEGAFDPASLKRFQEEIAQTGNEFTKSLAQSKALETLMNSFGSLASSIQDTLIPLFERLATAAGPSIEGGLGKIAELSEHINEHFNKYLTGLGLATAAYGGFKTMMALRGATRATPMYTSEVGMGGGGGFMGEGGGKKGRKGKGLGRLLKTGAKRLPLIGAALSLGMGAADMADISSREEAGKITKEEAKVEKAETAGSAAGGAGGALAGAAAGAAIGSVVPLLGTAIGGLIGGVVGGIGGDYLGGWLGKKSVEGTPKDKTVEGTPKDKTVESAADGAISETVKIKEIEKEVTKQEEITKDNEAGMGSPALKAEPITVTPEDKVSQNDTDGLLLSLNSKMEQLIRIAGNQLSVQKGMSSDLYA